MKKRLASALTLFILGLAFIYFAYFVGKTIEENKPALQPIIEELQGTVANETAEDAEPIMGEQTEARIVVTRIIDGDTLVISTGETVRLIGVDAPEKKDCYSINGANRLQELVLDKEITIEHDRSEKDRYGRTLLYIWVDGVFVNEILTKEGFADSKRYPPDIKYAPLLEAAEEEARAKNLGIWNTEACL